MCTSRWTAIAIRGRELKICLKELALDIAFRLQILEILVEVLEVLHVGVLSLRVTFRISAARLRSTR